MAGKFTTIIVDDEPHARFRLKEILKQTDKFTIVAEAKNGVEGKELINKIKPEVVFLDIQMPIMDGFEMLEHIDYDPFIIFCTAYNQYAIQAFETHSIDYLLKPVELSRLIKTLEKLYRISEQSAIIKLLQNELQQNEVEKKSDIIPVKIGDRIILIDLKQVAYFKASEKSVYFYEINGKKRYSEFTLHALESKLPKNFIRVSRAVIINKNCVKEFRKYFKGKYILVLGDNDNSRIISGSSYSDKLKRLFEF